MAITRVEGSEMANSHVLTGEIRSVLKTINGAWLSGNPDAVQLTLTSCFHPEMVMKGGDLRTVAAGRDACVQSYIDFIQRAKVSDFQQDEPDIHMFGDAAIASYTWRIAYALEGKEYDESGSDMFVFVRQKGKWLAVWRAMITQPKT
jgi:hypothetical protein